jgi:hypothetical protein
MSAGKLLSESIKQSDFDPVAFKNFLDAKDLCAKKLAYHLQYDDPVTISWRELQILRKGIPEFADFIDKSVI